MHLHPQLMCVMNCALAFEILWDSGMCLALLKSFISLTKGKIPNACETSITYSHSSQNTICRVQLISTSSATGPPQVTLLKMLLGFPICTPIATLQPIFKDPTDMPFWFLLAPHWETPTDQGILSDKSNLHRLTDTENRLLVASGLVEEGILGVWN